MKATIIGIGNEVLCGDVVNTNASYLSSELSFLGIEVVEQFVVSDDYEPLKRAVIEAMSFSELIITTGGLGPTLDDMSKEAIAHIFDAPLEKNEEAVKDIKAYFARSNRTITDNNYRQAYIPKGGLLLKNKKGTAPGVLLEKNGKILVMLPGPPRELNAMYKESVEEYLKGKMQKFFCVKTYMTVGIGESQLEDSMRKVLPETEGVSVNTYFNNCGVKVKAVAKASCEKEAEEKLSETDRIFKENFSEWIYSTEDEDLPKALLDELIKRNLTLSFAESCTGGLLSSLFVGNDGASKVYLGGIVSYSNDVKIKELGVKEETLKNYGAVSEECAKEMALGCAEKFNSDIAVSVTGIAGPTGGSEEKPVGTVYIGLYYKGELYCKRENITGERRRVQMRSSYYALNMIRKNVL